VLRLVPPHVRRRRRLASGVLAGTMVLAACGTGDEPSPIAETVVDTPAADVGVDNGDGATSEVDSSDPAVAEVDDGAAPVTEPNGDATAVAPDEASAASEPDTDAPADGVAATVIDGEVDLVGAEVIDAANIDTNLLPDVVVDDLTNDRKVNFRNLVPQDKPILLWMYAPH